jgi:hypothetical protein
VSRGLTRLRPQGYSNAPHGSWIPRMPTRHDGGDHHFRGLSRNRFSAEPRVAFQAIFVTLNGFPGEGGPPMTRLAGVVLRNR